jgi:prepilin-type N-terminal cleavage/methylation domain-containing protein
MKRPMHRSRLGFTLIELLVVIIIVGVLAAFAVPQYTKSLENNRADDGSAMVNMVGTANRMYALDHSGTYCAGQLANGCNSCSCGGGSAPCGAGTGCDLIACKYLAAGDYDNKPYIYFAGGGTCGDAGIGSMTGIACARRRKSSDSGTGGTGNATYQGWGYNVSAAGVVSALGTGSPSPTQ